MGDRNSKGWFAFVVRSQSEFKAEEELNNLGVQSYLPITIAPENGAIEKKK